MKTISRPVTKGRPPRVFRWRPRARRWPERGFAGRGFREDEGAPVAAAVRREVDGGAIGREVGIARPGKQMRRIQQQQIADRLGVVGMLAVELFNRRSIYGRAVVATDAFEPA